MAGAIDSLGVATALLNPEGRVLACCGRFVEMAGEPLKAIIGVRGRELIRQEDRASAVWLMSNLWRTGESFTSVSRFRGSTCRDRAYEGFVQRLEGGPTLMALSIIRPFGCRIAPAADPQTARGAADYVVDMARQLSAIAAQASMPVACDLLAAAADAGLREAGMEVTARAQA